MKTIFLLSLLSLFISVAFSDRLSANLNQQFLQMPVFTVDGHVLTLGSPYDVLTNAAESVGLCVTDTKNHSTGHGVCPHDVVQCSNNMPGLAVTFTPIFQTLDPFVRENIPYRLRFVINGPCAVDGSSIAITISENIHRWWVHTEDVSIVSQFNIQRSGLGYHIAFCMFSPVPYAPTPCFDTGFQVFNGYNRLGIGEGITGTKFYFRTTGIPVDAAAASS